MENYETLSTLMEKGKGRAKSNTLIKSAKNMLARKENDNNDMWILHFYLQNIYFCCFNAFCSFF